MTARVIGAEIIDPVAVFRRDGEPEMMPPPGPARDRISATISVPSVLRLKHTGRAGVTRQQTRSIARLSPQWRGGSTGYFGKEHCLNADLLNVRDEADLIFPRKSGRG